jgi:hypothetical protein
MRSPSVALQTAYYDELTSPAIFTNYQIWGASAQVWGTSSMTWQTANIGVAVPVYSDIAPASERRPYITLGQQTFIDDADKTAFGSVATQAVSVVTAFDGDRGGKRLSSLIADEVMRRIRKRTAPDMAPDFNCITSTLDSAITLTETTPTTTIIRAELRFRHIIEEI